MMRSLFSAVSGLKNHQTAMDIIGNNVANVNTTGFKSSRVIFQDIFSQTISSATAPTATTGGVNGKQVGLGVTLATVGQNMTEGSTQSTSKELDFAISGDGFFVVDTGAGQYYTRNGALEIDSEGYLVTGGGDYLMAVTGEDVTNDDEATTLSRIKVRGEVEGEIYSDHAIDENGIITAVDSLGQTVTLGRLVLATFNNSAGLEKLGSSYYDVSPNSGDPAINFVNNHCGKLKGGSLEMSNVDLATELTNMIIMQRGFQANSRVITTSDSLLEELVNLKR